MPSALPQQQWPRGPRNELHKAAAIGSIDRTVALLSSGAIDIDVGDPHGVTPLMIASMRGQSGMVRILLNKGAGVSIVADGGCTALHFSAGQGHLAISKMLTDGGADLEAATEQGGTPLHLAAEGGHLEVMSVLIELGTNPNSRSLTGRTPLYDAAHEGHVDAVKVLLRAKADPLLASRDAKGVINSPLDIAALFGHSEVVRELIQQVGIEGCRGESGGINALGAATMRQHVDIMAMLTSAGVIDNGDALLLATVVGKEASVKFLLQQQQEWKASGETVYLNAGSASGFTPLLLRAVMCPSPRIVRLLVDAGADTARVDQITDDWGRVEFNGTPIALTTDMLRAKKIGGEDATEEQLHKLAGIRRLLSRMEAIYAVSWLWPSDALPEIDTPESERKTRTTSTPLRMMLPILRRRARRLRGVPLATLLSRHSEKNP